MIVKINKTRDNYVITAMGIDIKREIKINDRKRLRYILSDLYTDYILNEIIVYESYRKAKNFYEKYISKKQEFLEIDVEFLDKFKVVFNGKVLHNLRLS